MNICKVSECNRPVYAKKYQLCSMHHKRLWRHGNVNKGPTKTCTLDNCNKPHLAGGLCNRHYRQKERGLIPGTARTYITPTKELATKIWHLYRKEYLTYQEIGDKLNLTKGQVGYIANKFRYLDPGKLCKIPDCDESYHAKGFCKTHYQQYRYHNNVQSKLRSLLRSRLYMALRNYGKRGSAVKDLGCSVKELKEHIESLWEPGMTWDNWSKDGWHIDHIIPLASFDLEDREQFLQAVHYTNLQPLWCDENWSKR